MPEGAAQQSYLTRVRLLLVLILAGVFVPVWSQELQLPLREGSLRFGVIGDSGTGGREQYEVGNQMSALRTRFPFELVLMLGDNLYGGEKPSDYEKKFERPYKALLQADVKFYASLGNHDESTQRFYKLFNMNGNRYYSFKAPRQSVRFFSLDTTYMDRKQLDWIEKELRDSNEDWKVCFFHHPLYSSGERHGSDLALRTVMEPMFLANGVDLVLAGHDHFYERIKPQKGIHYFVSGGAAKLRTSNIGKSDLTARGFDTDRHFLLMEIAGDELYFQAVSRTGQTVDSGVITRREVATTSGH